MASFSRSKLCFSALKIHSLKQRISSESINPEQLKKAPIIQAAAEIKYKSVLIKNPGFIKNATEVIYTMEGFDSENSHSKSVNLSEKIVAS